MKWWIWPAGGAALFGIGFAVGRFTAQKPAVELHTESGYQGAETEVFHAVQGPVRVVTRTITTPAPGCTAPATDTTVTEDRAPLITDRQTDSIVVATERTDLKVTPQALPRWAAGAGLEDPLGAKRLRVEAGMRLLGPIWLRGGWTVANGLSGASVGSEVQW